MNDTRCGTCGGPVSPDLAQGLCPACLMAAVLDAHEESQPELRETDGLPPHAAGDPSRIGPYLVVRRIAEGGMGVVYLARQETPIVREVAIKVVRPGLDSHQVLTRFQQERQAMALMDHPGIAHVFDAGSLPDGRPYFVMEYVVGCSITEYCDTHSLDVDQRLALFHDVCLAVHHAHSRGLIHRDIKPSNILVGERDGRPVVKVIDFGIAKALFRDLAADAGVTEQGLFIGTAEYMSPERARLGDRHGTASDIYSLGVVLYELLTGTLPIEVQSLRQAGFFEVARAICEQEPPAPSRRVSAAADEADAGRRRTNRRALAHRLRNDLDWITLRAIAKNPVDRYASASELAADIARHLAGDPVVAGRPTPAYRLGKFVRKNRLLVGSAFAILLSILAGLGTSTGLYLEEQRQRQRAEHESYLAGLANAEQRLQSGDYAGARGQLFRCPPHLRGWEWHLLYALSDTSVVTLHAGGDPLSSFPPAGHFAFDRDGRVSFSMLRTVHSWRVGTWQPAGVSPVLGLILAMSGDGRRVISRSPRQPDSLTIVELGAGDVTATLSRSGGTSAAAFSPDGSLVATAGTDGTLRVWRAETGTLEKEVRRSQPSTGTARLAWGAHGRRLAWSAGDEVWIVDVPTGRLADRIQMGAVVSALTCQPTGLAVAVADVNGHVRVRGENGHENSWADADVPYSVAFSPDGRRLVTALHNGRVRVWDVASGAELATLSGTGEHEVAAVSFSPSGEFVLVGSRKGTVRVWDVLSRGGGTVLERGASLLTASGDRRTIAVVLADRSVLIDGGTGRRIASLPLTGTAVALDPRGERLAVGDAGGEFRVVDTRTAAALLSWTGHDDAALSIAFSPDGKLLATSSAARDVKVWDAGSARLLVSISLPEESAAIAFSPDGQYLVTGSGSLRRSLEGGAVALWNAATGEPVDRLAPEWKWAEIVRTLAFDRAGGHLATGEFASGTIRVYDGHTRRFLADLQGHQTEVTALSFSPDGALIASGSRDNTLRLWDARRFEPLLVLSRPDAAPTGLAFGPDGGRLYAVYADGTFRVWSTVTTYPAAAVELVHDWLARDGLWADVRDRLRTDRSLDPALREAALGVSAGWMDWSPAGVSGISEPLVTDTPGGLSLETVWRRAEDLYRTAPHSLTAAALAGAARYRNGRHAEAIELLARVAAAEPEDPLADLFLALSYAKTGQSSAARRHLEQARSLFAGLPVVDARQMTRLLRSVEVIVPPLAAGDTPASTTRQTPGQPPR